MSYTNVYPSRINWENEPSIVSPINATNLNKIDYAVYEHDRTLETWDVTKANQSDLLLSVKSIDYDDETGVFIFTWQNGTTKTVDLNIEKIPVSFSMSPLGVITMTTEDGTTYTADVGALIKTYTFTDSARIDFTVTTDLSGNKTVTADIVDGSITGAKLQPDYLADCQSAATSASNSATTAGNKAQDSEAWAVGERGGVPVPSTDPAYENNAKWYAEHGTGSSLAGLSDTDITSPTNGQVLTYDGSKWINDDPSAGGGSKVVVSTAEASLIGTVCTLAQGGDSYSATFDSLGVAIFEGVTLTGTVTITATDGQSTATRTLEIPYFGNYTQTISFFSATITATFPADKGATCTCDGVTASTSPYTFTVGAAGTYSVVCTLDGVNKSVSVPITTDGQSESVNFAFGTINLTYDNAFRGLAITCASGGTTISKTAPISGNTMAFYPPSTGTWSVSGTYSGQTYSKNAVVTSLSTAVSVQLQTTQTVSVTIYSAVGDTITYTDIYSVSRMITLGANSDHATASIDIQPSGSTLTFTSSVAKNPNDLSKYYSKSVTITNSTSEIKVMPDKSLYWWGYESDDLEDCTSANGWSYATYSFTTPTHNTRNISITSRSGYVISGVGTKNAVSGTTLYAISKGISAINGNYGGIGTEPSKAQAYADYLTVESNTLAKYTRTFSGSKYLYVQSDKGRTLELSALWYE